MVKVGHGWSKPPILRRRFWSKHQFYAADMVIIGQKIHFVLIFLEILVQFVLYCLILPKLVIFCLIWSYFVQLSLFFTLICVIYCTILSWSMTFLVGQSSIPPPDRLSQDTSLLNPSLPINSNNNLPCT